MKQLLLMIVLRSTTIDRRIFAEQETLSIEQNNSRFEEDLLANA